MRNFLHIALRISPGKQRDAGIHRASAGPSGSRRSKLAPESNSATPTRHVGRLGITVLLLTTLVSAERAGGQVIPNFTEQRQRMVDREIVAAGIKNERVIEALRNTPRHEFVAIRERPQAYYDMALPIGEGQTISPPFVVAYMTEQLDPQPSDKVLEIGTGSGYQAAVLSPLVKEVYSIEIVEPLGRQAARTLTRLKYPNVQTKIGDGFQGWAEHAPFDKIIVTCSPENVPQPLIDQLREAGRMIVPLGQRYQQTLYLFRKQEGKLVPEALRPTLFVPMTGRAEELREVKPDPLRPSLLNGSFEEVRTEDGATVPVSWHYVRQASVVDDPLSPEGQRHLRFMNLDAGRGSQMLQAFAIDGRKVATLQVSLRVRATDVRPGQTPAQLPVLAITFYDENQNTVGERGIGPWRGTFGWQLESETLNVPPRAVHAILRLGLFGAIGQLDVDDLRLSPGTK